MYCVKTHNAGILLINSEDTPCEYFKVTGGKGSINQWVHAEYMVGSETICPPFTH